MASTPVGRRGANSSSANSELLARRGPSEAGAGSSHLGFRPPTDMSGASSARRGSGIGVAQPLAVAAELAGQGPSGPASDLPSATLGSKHLLNTRTRSSAASSLGAHSSLRSANGGYDCAAAAEPRPTGLPVAEMSGVSSARRGSGTGLAGSAGSIGVAQPLAVAAELAGQSPRGPASDLPSATLGSKQLLNTRTRHAAAPSLGTHPSLRSANGGCDCAAAAEPRPTGLPAARGSSNVSHDNFFANSASNQAAPQPASTSMISSSAPRTQVAHQGLSSQAQARTYVPSSRGGVPCAPERPPRASYRVGLVGASAHTQPSGSVAGIPPRPRGVQPPTEIYAARPDPPAAPAPAEERILDARSPLHSAARVHARAARDSSHAHGGDGHNDRYASFSADGGYGSSRSHGVRSHGYGRRSRGDGALHGAAAFLERECDSRARGSSPPEMDIDEVRDTRLQQEEGDRAFAERIAREQEAAAQRDRMRAVHRRARLAQVAEDHADDAAGTLASGRELLAHLAAEEDMQALFAAMLWAQDEADYQDALRQSAAEAYSGGFTVPPADETIIDRLTSVTTYADCGAQSSQCGICLEEYDYDDALRTLQCGHRFHVMCVDQWLSQSGQCPVCKHPVRE